MLLRTGSRLGSDSPGVSTGAAAGCGAVNGASGRASEKRWPEFPLPAWRLAGWLERDVVFGECRGSAFFPEQRE